MNCVAVAGDFFFGRGLICEHNIPPGITHRGCLDLHNNVLIRPLLSSSVFLSFFLLTNAGCLSLPVALMEKGAWDLRPFYFPIYHCWFWAPTIELKNNMILLKSDVFMLSMSNSNSSVHPWLIGGDWSVALEIQMNSIFNRWSFFFS